LAIFRRVEEIQFNSQGKRKEEIFTKLTKDGPNVEKKY